MRNLSTTVQLVEFSSLNSRPERPKFSGFRSPPTTTRRSYGAGGLFQRLGSVPWHLESMKHTSRDVRQLNWVLQCREHGQLYRHRCTQFCEKSPIGPLSDPPTPFGTAKSQFYAGFGSGIDIRCSICEFLQPQPFIMGCLYYLRARKSHTHEHMAMEPEHSGHVKQIATSTCTCSSAF
jgi:hypothetical protein